MGDTDSDFENSSFDVLVPDFQVGPTVLSLPPPLAGSHNDARNVDHCQLQKPARKFPRSVLDEGGGVSE